MPKISVCIPVRNGELYLTDAIETIKDQTFKDWEIVICDDLSTDSTERLLKYYKKNLSGKITIFRNKENLGIGASRNKCVSVSKGSIICVQDADDVSHKERLAKTWKYFQRHKSIDIVYGSYEIINPFGKPIERIYAYPFDVEVLKTRNFIPHPTIAYRKDSFLSVGGYRDSFKVLDDYALYLDFYRAGMKFGVIEDVLAFYRVSANGVSRSKEKEEMVKEFRQKLAEEWKCVS